MDRTARSEQARRIEAEIVRKSGKAAEDPRKPPQERFEEMGEQPAIREKAGRDKAGG
ncbi:MAG TPA: hypothetical protein VEB20_25845 [Azospirillaceae bacterium]|nr:hypothetical protein [Azospirillaceae bacterium]